jgi:hypothetical protein
MQQAVDEVAAALEQVFKAQPETKEIETADAARIKEVAPAQSKPEDSRRVA